MHYFSAYKAYVRYIGVYRPAQTGFINRDN